ncbi:unnamed protein product [Phaedon cochleariae]|uniref:Uncharacterized protein n=1 Tax=Phaedon cochleariae TaxID=80249 RepID=A0A9P0DU45_PHACE|nr:unnamed protein product [Phaedon cochleariae]
MPKPRRTCKFNKELQLKYPMFKPTKTDADNSDVHCPTCKSIFSIANKGKCDLDQHLNTMKHKKNIREAEVNNKVTDFLVPKYTNIELQISAAEGTLAFHTVHHHLSFRSCDCSVKLIKKIIPDSSMAKKISCARTKSEAIIVGVIAPYSLNMAVQDAKKSNVIGIATDASNHGSLKVFPVLIQFFDKRMGLSLRLIEVGNLENEKSDTIANYLTNILQKNDLKDNCIAFSGDNCNTNFGGMNRKGTQNVFSKLKNLVNLKLVGIGCPAHILNNCVQSGTDTLRIDIDSLVLKIYNHFSIYTIRTESLKHFCEFVEIDYKKLLYHSKTRWLSLFPCLNRILEIYPALESYFLSENNPPVTIKSFFEDKLNESYLWFLHSLMYIFNEKIKAIEREGNSILEILECLEDIKACLRERMQESFFPMKVKEIFRKFERDGKEIEVSILKKNFLFVYERCYEYLYEWTKPFESFENLKWMNLKNIPSWESIQESITFFIDKGINIQESLLFDQFCNLKNFLKSSLKDDSFNHLLSHEKWTKYFNDIHVEENYSEFLKICQYFFAVPAQNANLERIFSLMNSQWTDERNRLNISTVESILITQFNFKKYSCEQFYDHLMSNKDLLHKISSSQKYS